MATLQVLVLSMLAVLFCAPFTYAADTSEIMSYYPPFPKCNPAVVRIIETLSKIYPSQDVLTTLASQEKWVIIKTSYGVRMTDAYCLNMQIQDNNLIVIVKNKNTEPYTFNYTITNRLPGGGLEGTTDPAVPERSWVIYPVLVSDVFMGHYVCNKEYETKDVPLHSQILISSSFLQKIKDVTTALNTVNFISKFLEPFTKFTFVSTLEC